MVGGALPPGLAGEACHGGAAIARQAGRCFISLPPFCFPV